MGPGEIGLRPMKKPMTFRLSDEVRARLAELAAAWETNATAIVERLILSARIEGEKKVIQTEEYGEVTQSPTLVLQHDVSKPNLRRSTIPKPEWKK